MDLDFQEQDLELQKLVKRSYLLIISFFLFLITDVILFVYLQTNKLFMFNLGRTEESIPNPLITDIFTTIFYVIIIVSTVTYIIYTNAFLKKTYENKPKLFKQIHNWADYFSVVPVFMFIVIIINGFFFSIAKVDGDSMQPNFCDNDTVVITYNGEIATDDVLILENDDSFLIKRVVALPGDKLVIDDSGVYVNDTLVEAFLLSNHFEYDGVIPADYYFVLGGNRSNSLDSRVIGLIEADRILGEVIYHINTNTCN